MPDSPARRARPPPPPPPPPRPPAARSALPPIEVATRQDLREKDWERADKLRGRVVDAVRDHVTGASAEIRLNPRTFEFSVRVAATVFASADGAEVRSWARKALKDHDSVVWTPLVQVHVAAVSAMHLNGRVRAAYHGGCEVEMRRFYAALSVDGKTVRQIDWDTLSRMTPSAAFASSEDAFPLTVAGFGNLPYHDFDEEEEAREERSAGVGNYDRSYYLAYDEGLYEGLKVVVALLQRARVQLFDLLGSPEGLSRIASAPPDALLALAGAAR